jgi:tetratricopeptide (TPR) repeat protein
MAFDESWMYDESNEIIYGITVDLWLERVLLYCLIFAFILGIFSCLDFISSSTEKDSARYLLSALVQCEAAVFALVITLSLVAVQISASSYSARVIKLFKGMPDFWILILIYIFSIFYGLAVLKMIDQDTENLKYNISISYVLGVYAFVALVPYFLNVIELTNPYTLISILSKNINENKILSSLHMGDRNDPFQPLMDIIYASIKKYDIGIVFDGLEAMESKINFILNNAKEENDKIDEIIFQFLSHVSGLGKLAGDRRDEDIALMVASILNGIGIDAAKRSFNKVAAKTIRALGPFGINCVENNLEYPASRVIFSLRSIGIIFLEKRFEEGVVWAAQYIQNIGTKSVENQLGEAIGMSATSLESIAVTAVEMKTETAMDRSLMALGSIGLRCAENKLELPAINVVLALEKVGIAYINNNLEGKAVEAVGWFDSIGFQLCRDNFENAVSSVIASFNKMGIEAAKNEQHRMTARVVESLGSMGICAIENGLRKVTDRIVMNLGSLGSTFAKGNSELGSTSAVQSLERIALKCIDLNFLDLTINIITYFRNIGLQAARSKLPGAAGQSSDSLKVLAEKVDKLEHYKFICIIAEALGKIGVESAENELDCAAFSAVNGLMAIVKITNENKQFDRRQDVIISAAKCLKEIGETSAKKGLTMAATQAAYAFGSFSELSDDNKEIIGSYLKSILEESKNANTCFHIARSFNSLNLFIKAEDASNKAICIDPNHALAYLQLHNALKAQGTFLLNSRENQRAQKKIEDAEKALAKYKELMKTGN